MDVELVERKDGEIHEWGGYHLCIRYNWIDPKGRMWRVFQARSYDGDNKWNVDNGIYETIDEFFDSLDEVKAALPWLYAMSVCAR